MKLGELFKIYLKTQGVSPVTVKNYLADVNHFFNWLTQKTGIRHQVAGNSIFGLFTRETLNEYKTDLRLSETPSSTINRRLSALRKLGQFAKSNGLLPENPAKEVVNTPRQDSSQNLIEGILGNFRKYLEKKQASQITIKNYLSDLRDFLSWVEANKV